MLLRSAARLAAALAVRPHHATLRSQAARGAKRPAAKASTRSPILKPPLRTAERRTVKAAGSSAARHTPSSARMRPKPKSVGTAIGVGSRVVDSAGTCGEIVARNVAWLTMRSDAGEERSVRVHSLKPVAPLTRGLPPPGRLASAPEGGGRSGLEGQVAPSVGVGDAVEAHYGTDEDELWWPATNPHPNPSLGLSLSLSLTLTQTP